MFNTQINVTTVEEEPEAIETDADRRRRKHSKRQQKKGEPQSGTTDPETFQSDDAGPLRPGIRAIQEGEQQQVLMVEVENMQKEEFKQTEEVKALTQEVIKTIRDIITMNPLYRDSLQQMLHQNQRVVDNPVYLCDLGASLSAADPYELQAILEEQDVGRERAYLSFVS